MPSACDVSNPTGQKGNACKRSHTELERTCTQSCSSRQCSDILQMICISVLLTISPCIVDDLRIIVMSLVVNGVWNSDRIAE